MKKLFYLLICLAPLLSFGAKKEKVGANLIPYPTSVEWKSGGFALKNGVTIFADKAAQPIATYLQDVLSKNHGVSSEVKVLTPDANTKKAISFALVTDEKFGDQGYELSVSSSEVTVKAKDIQGLFASVSTLQQLIPVDGKRQLTAVKIFDKPQFGWREVMLDVGRHFYNKEQVKRYIDLVALYKFNRFHWHLTEDQGWRIEIKKYPKLTEDGAWRTEIDGTRYGGFYTQEDIKDVVAYATSRGITIIPEIEMPGHSVAALTAYPELSCTGGPFEVRNTWGVADDVYCAGNEKTFTFVQDVLTEVMNLFPSEYIHIGGDECPKARWEKCPKCQQRIADNGLKNEHELQSYFIRRIEKFLNDNGRRLIGWDEILEGGLAPNATVQLWRDWDHAVKAATEGHDVIMTPTSHCYFDYLQKNLPLDKVYSLNPIPENLDPQYHKHILGAGANLWTERIPGSDRADYMLFPRIQAIAECLWNGKSRQSYDKFLERVRKEYVRWDKMGVKFGPEGRDFTTTVEPNIADRLMKVNIKSDIAGLEYHYTTDGTVPTISSQLVNGGEVIIREKGDLTIGAFQNKKPFGTTVSYSFDASKAFGRPVSIKNPLGASYRGQYNDCLTDGLRGSTSSYNDGLWQGIAYNDFVAEVDLGEVKEVRSLSLGSFQDVGAWIFYPVSVVFEVSEDGVNFTAVGSAQVPLAKAKQPVFDFKVNFARRNVKVVRVTAKNIGCCPEWHAGKGAPAWLFVDELKVE